MLSNNSARPARPSNLRRLFRDPLLHAIDHHIVPSVCVFKGGLENLHLFFYQDLSKY